MITTISLVVNIAAIAFLALNLRKKNTQINIAEVRERPAGFIDFKTGRRVEINQATRKEEFVS
ncbi:hypothetical protein [Streptococcus danieliae]|uniref:Uncharacterized protein n=1 Tax=Streptococcus danieliae TaxID=747656 RepID=A0A7Z0S4W7_9STRE|nr:hypothetical protein [Streptococcus danieliae]MBF0699458.1 hypothetical protein [Streptococcus danieliae]NYS96634.1 hypothetical protein [Streptococcus danieliae]